MIVATGIDIEDNERFERAIARHGDRFLKKIFTDDEIAYCRRQGRCAQHFAVRFAAKEAVLKALRHGPQGAVSLKEIEIVKGADGEPHIKLLGRAPKVVKSLGITALHVSLSHAATHCVAQVIAEGRRMT